MATKFPCSSPPSLCDQSPNPLTAFSSEAVDGPTFIGDGYAPNLPLLNKSFTVYACEAQAESQVSQEDADLSAARLAVQCANPCSPLFSNTQQTVSRNCTDGTPYFFVVRAGTFLALSQLQADRMAIGYGQSKLGSHSICMAALPQSVICQGAFFSADVVVTTPDGPVTFELIQGTLPPGISMLGESGSLFFSGTPTTLGNYVFSIKATSSFGMFTQKTFSLLVTAITTGSSLPNAFFNVPYTQQLNLYNPNSLTVAWSLASGQLPAGLTLNAATGLISGTPTNGGTFNFTVRATMDGGSCTAPFTIQAFFINFDNLVWTNFSASGGGTGTFVGKAFAVQAPPGGLVKCLGTMSYTGPLVNCKALVTVTQGATSTGFFVFQDGAQVAQFNATTIGSFELDFTLAAGNSSVIQIRGLADVGTDPVRCFVLAGATSGAYSTVLSQR